MKDYVDVSVDIVSQDNFRYHIQTNPDLEDCVDILYQELDGKKWVTKDKIECLTESTVDKLFKGVKLVLENSYLCDDIQK